MWNSYIRLVCVYWWNAIIYLSFPSILANEFISSDMCRSKSLPTPTTYPNCMLRTDLLERFSCSAEGEMDFVWKRSSPKDDKIIVCSAPYPINVRIQLRLQGAESGIGIIYLDTPQLHREVENIYNTSSYRYIVRIPFGYYVYFKSIISSVEVSNAEFLEERTILVQFVERDQKEIEPFNKKWNGTVYSVTEEIFKVPCATLNGTFPEGVYKRVYEKDQSQSKSMYIPVDGKTLYFDQHFEFRLNTSAMDIFGTYDCKFYSDDEKEDILQSTFSLVDIIGAVKPTPDNSDLEIFTFSRAEVTLECHSNVSIHLNGFINFKSIQKVFSSKARVGGKNIFSIKHVISDFMVGDSGKISCSDDVTGTELYHWNIDVINVTKRERRISFWMSRYRALCANKFLDEKELSTLKLKRLECRNPMECEAWRFCLNEGVSCSAVSLTPGIPCTGDNDKVLRNVPCQQTTPFANGIISCQTDLKTVHTIMYFTGFDGNLYNDWRDAPLHALLKVVTPDGGLYTRESFEFTCRAHNMLTCGDLQWLLELSDGSSISSNQSTIKGKLTDESVIITTSTIFLPPDVRKIICLAPVWNSNQWINITKKLAIRESILPVIKTTNTEVQFRIGSKDQTLVCDVESFPVAEVIWAVHVEESNESKFIDQNLTVFNKPNSASLVFPEFTESLVGDYICIATGIGGATVSKVFSVKIKHDASLDWLYAVGAILFIALIGGTVWVRILLKRAASKQINLNDDEIAEFENGREESTDGLDYTNPYSLAYEKKYEIPRTGFTIEQGTAGLLGSGSFGIVYKGKCIQGNVINDIAVKTVMQSIELVYFKALLSELKLIIYIGKHPNIVQLIGASTDQIRFRILYVLLEFCPNGNLLNYLIAHRSEFQNLIVDDVIVYENLPTVEANSTKNNCSTMDLIRLCLDIISALQFLKQRQVLHGDIAARNILLDANLRAKLADFGLSRVLVKCDNYVKKTKEPLPWRYMAIESLESNTFSYQSDIWSFGVAMWEIFTLGRVPHSSLNHSPEFVSFISNGLRLAQPEFATTAIYEEVLSECWKKKPADRINLERMEAYFREIYIVPQANVLDDYTIL